MEDNTMKKIILSTASIAALILAASCNKQALPTGNGISDEVKFTASIDEEVSKSLLVDGGKVNWEDTDHVYINRYSRFSVRPQDPATKADLILEDGYLEPVAPYEAIYPSGLCVDGEYILPETQLYSEGKFNAPMYAAGNSGSLSFKNICGVISLSLKGEDKIKSITVKANGEPISGAFYIIEGTDDKMSMKQGGGQTVTLDCGEGAQLNMSTPKKLYIYLPPKVYSAGMTFTIINSNNKQYVKTTKSNTNIERNHVYNFDWQFGGPKPNYLPGKFYTGNGETVHFAKGNLYYNGSSYKFEDHQYDFPRGWDDNHIGHFYWSKDESKARAKFYDEDESCSSNDVIFTNSTTTTPNSSFTVNGETGKYRCLSKDEWNYLLRVRYVNGGRGKGYSYSIEKNITIQGSTYHGIFLFPDGFTRQNTWKTDYKTWDEIDEAGIVFLPLLGYRTTMKISETKIEFYHFDEWGTYMSSSTYTDDRHVWFGIEYYNNKEDLEKLDDDNPPYREFGNGYRLAIKL